jgi:predicted SnoaL-like aldol condensation-catalyzing enzyme
MSVKNKNIVINFMTDFIEGNNESYKNYLTDDIKWNIIGMPSICGKQNFIRAMEMMELWQSSLKENDMLPDKVKNIIAESDFVVVESGGQNDNSGNCSIYKIKNGKIREVTTYIVDTSVNT